MTTKPTLDVPRALARLRLAIVLSLLFFALFAGIAGGFVAKALLNPGFVVRQLENYAPPVPTRILDVRGRVISSFYAEKREIIPFHEIPPALIQATLATEDEHFEGHYGFNPWRILKAAFVDVITLSKEQGGSTITLQLSKVLFLDHGKRFTRKIAELWYAIQIERLYTKKEILWFYFNQINYGHGCYGVEAAAQFYFRKHAHDLGTAECALLAGIPKSPVYFSPLRYPRNAIARHRLVLSNLVRKGLLTRPEAIALHEDFWLEFSSKTRVVNATVSEMERTEAPYFIEYVRDRLEKLFNRETLYKGGLTVYTTLNLDHQRAAEKYLKEKLEEQDRMRHWAMRPIREALDNEAFDQVELHALALGLPVHTARTRRQNQVRDRLQNDAREPLKTMALLFGADRLHQVLEAGIAAADAEDNEDEKAEGAFVSIDPSTGHITAMVGGTRFQYYNQFNRVLLARRQIGSAVKPFIYAPAIDKKLITAATPLSDAPIAFGGVRAGEDELYVPKNYDGDYKGTIPAREALRRSVNTCALLVLDKVGSETVREYAKKIFHIKTDKDLWEKFPNDVTMGLGTGAFTPMEMAQAFGVFANEGREIIPLSIRSVVGRGGEVITNFEKVVAREKRASIFSAATAFLMTDILSGVFDAGGTANRRELDGYRLREVSSGKTGTTGNWTDAWFVGFHRYLVAAVWIGYDSNKSLGRGRTGGDLSAPVWINFMKEIYTNARPVEWKPPSDLVKVRVSRNSGKLESPNTIDGREEWFQRGTEPSEYDDSYGREVREKQHFIDLIRKKKPGAVLQGPPGDGSPTP